VTPLCQWQDTIFIDTFFQTEISDSCLLVAELSKVKVETDLKFQHLNDLMVDVYVKIQIFFVTLKLTKTIYNIKQA
jgi:hypothetical protein